MRKINLLLTFLSIYMAVSAQNTAASYCGSGRYDSEVFSNFTKTADVVYGQNTTYTGSNQSLKLDIYQPVGDNAEARPLLIMAHGGSFTAGSKTDADMVAFGQRLSKMGYVVASIDYRLGMPLFPLPDSVVVMKAVVRAVHDMRAAVRYFRKNAAEDGNTYKIDPNQIYVGGSSAGAITALHTAYLDDLNEAPQYLKDIMNQLGGGIEGNSGNPGYSSVPAGVLNGCGAIGELSWILQGDLPIVSVHGTNDNVVPYGTQMQYLPGTPVAVTVVDGSGSIHPYVSNLGIANSLWTFQGAGHVPYMNGGPYMDTTINVYSTFLTDLICGTTGIGQSSLAEFIRVSPNPASGFCNISLQLPAANLSILDLTGKQVGNSALKQGENQVELTSLNKGIYFLQISSEGKQFVQKLVVY